MPRDGGIDRRRVPNGRLLIWGACLAFVDGGHSFTSQPGDQWLLWGCAVTRRRFPVGASPTRRFAPAGSNRSSHGGNEMAEAFDKRSRLGDRARVQAATRVNAEKASKR